MSNTPEHFSAEMVKDLRERLRDAIVWPSHGLPEGFSNSPSDPTKALSCVDSLHMMPGFVLCGYQFCAGANGNGFVFAMPEDVPFPDPSECPQQEVEAVSGVFLDSPKPPQALEHFMAGIEGDGAAQSYLEASILFRELTEFGAIWHGCEWSTHAVLDTDPFDPATGQTDRDDDDFLWDPAKWQWHGRRPSDWRPSVALRENGGADVRFITLSELGTSALYKHHDRFARGSLRPKTTQKTLAVGPGGYVF